MLAALSVAMSVERVIEIARGMISGQISIVEGSRQLALLSPEVTGKDLDPDFVPFIGIDSESDHIPLGEVRERWSKEGLERMDAEQREIEDHHRTWAIEASHKLLERYAGRNT